MSRINKGPIFGETETFKKKCQTERVPVTYLSNKNISGDAYGNWKESGGKALQELHLY